MEPKEILALLRKHKHDGQIDWEHYKLRNREYYFSKTQVAFTYFLRGLSPLSAEIIAKHYHAKEILEGG